MKGTIEILDSCFVGPALTLDRCEPEDWTEADLPQERILKETADAPELRRIGPFIKLALTGALGLIEKLPPDYLREQRVGVFLGSGLNNIVESRPFYQSLFSPDCGHFSPTKFANSVGNAATFYLAKLAGLRGESFNITQEEFSFEGALYNAELALALGTVDYALVGGSDYFAVSRDYIAERYNLRRHDLKVGEGSAWVLLQRSPHPQTTLENVLFDYSKDDFATKLLRQKEELSLGQNIILAPGFRLNDDETAIAAEIFAAKVEPYLEASGAYPTAAAFATCRFLQSSTPGIERDFLHLQLDTDGHTALMHIKSGY